MQRTDGQTGRTSHNSVYRSVEELKSRLTDIYGPSIKMDGANDSRFLFKTSNVGDGALLLCNCYTSDKLDSTFNSDNDDIILTTRSRGEFAIRTWCGDYQLSQGVGFVYTMNHTLGYASTKSTATTTLQIGRSDFSAALRTYSEDIAGSWSGIQSFSQDSGFGHLIQALSNRYHENFDGRPDSHYSEASLKLVRDATIVAIAELIFQGLDSQRREKFVASRRNVMRAVDLINTQTSPLTIHDLATTLGISVRALQDGFRKHLNASPHNVLKTGRLEGARRDLMSGKESSVREAATKWGFSNLARFSHEYFAAIGECPKETIRIWRGGGAE